MKAAAIDGDDSRMSRDTAMRFALQVGDEAAADQPRRVLVDFLGIESANVVGLEDAGLMLI